MVSEERNNERGRRPASDSNLGWLFKDRAKTDSEEELVLFITRRS